MPPTGEVVVHVAASVLRGETVWGLSRLVQELGLPALSLDLGGVQLVTAEGLGKLLALHGDLRGSGARLTLVNVGGAARRVIDDAGLTGVLDVRGRRLPPKPPVPRPARRARHVPSCPSGTRSRRHPSPPRRELPHA
jgi:anti-anti-sigma regulatory factor